MNLALVPANTTPVEGLNIRVSRMSFIVLLNIEEQEGHTAIWHISFCSLELLVLQYMNLEKHETQ